MKRLVLVLGLCVLPLSGCTFLKQLFAGAFQKPRFTFRGADLTEASLSSATVNVTYSLENPNPIGLDLAEVDYAFFIDDKQVVAGKPAAGMRIAANGASQLVFPANVKFAEIAPVVQTFLTQDYANYRAEGRIGVRTPVGIITFPISVQDRFEIPKIPYVQVGQPRIASLSLTGAVMEFPLQVTNRNTYDLPISGLSGAVQIAGANVGSLATNNFGAIGGKATKELVLPLTIHFGQAAAAALALRQGSGNVGFHGQLQSGGLSVPFNFQQNLAFRR